MIGANYKQANFGNLHRGAIYLGQTVTHKSAKPFNMTTSEAFKSINVKQTLNTAIPSPRKSPGLFGGDDRYSSN